MMITKKTKKLLIVALVCAVVSIIVGIYLFIQIQQQGEALSSHMAILAEAEEKQETFARIRRTVGETEIERQKIKAAFFADQSDSLGFITYIEDDLAPRAGLELKTESLAAVPVADNPNATDMRMQFSYTGSKAAVVDFSRLLEVLPYHSRIEALSLTQGSTGKWQGQVTLVIVLSTL